MKTSTALMCVQKCAASGVAALRRRLRERALDESAMHSRVWMKALEPRRMLSGASDPSGNSAFSYYGLASVTDSSGEGSDPSALDGLLNDGSASVWDPAGNEDLFGNAM